MKKTPRITGPASRMSIKADTKLKGKGAGLVAAVSAAIGTVPTSIQMTMDAFNVVHARIALADGVAPVSDPSALREKLFEVVATAGWEQTVVLLASCARLFAEVPSPLPDLSKITKQFLHEFAQSLDARAQPMRHVDRDATTRPPQRREPNR